MEPFCPSEGNKTQTAVHLVVGDLKRRLSDAWGLCVTTSRSHKVNK